MITKEDGEKKQYRGRGENVLWDLYEITCVKLLKIVKYDRI